MTLIEDAFAFQLTAHGIAYEREYHAIPGRRYRWDFRVGDILIEIQGGTWSPKRTGHSTGAGIKRDCEKLNIATLNGWRTLNFTSDMVTSGEAVLKVKEAINGNG